MLQKITATLILALVAQSTAFVIKTLRDGPTVPGFTYTATKTADHEQLTLTAPSGIVDFNPYGFFYQSPWEFSSSNGANTIHQKTLLTATYISFKNTKATVGDVTVENELIAYSANSTYQLAFTASATDGETCKLVATIAAVEIDPYFFFRAFGENGAAFRAVSKNVGTVVAKAVSDELSVVLTELLNQRLAEILYVEGLCETLLAGTENDFPKPEL